MEEAALSCGECHVNAHTLTQAANLTTMNKPIIPVKGTGIVVLCEHDVLPTSCVNTALYCISHQM